MAKDQFIEIKPGMSDRDIMLVAIIQVARKYFPEHEARKKFLEDLTNTFEKMIKTVQALREI